MSKTPIEWTEQTWNPIRGCSPVSPGCKLCYAEKTGGRFCKPGQPFHGFVQIGKNGEPGPHWTGKVEILSTETLEIPIRRRIPTMYFVNSMSDMFHELLPDEAIDRIFAVMALCPHHTFQVLTKRAERMRQYMHRIAAMVSGEGFLDSPIAAATRKASFDAGHPLPGNAPLECWTNTAAWKRDKSLHHCVGFPPRNVWLGVSVEDQERKSRIDTLRETPASLRFLSLEPLLEDLGSLDLRGIHWVIVGGESGFGARPCHVDWVMSVVAQCQMQGVPCFVKQLGSHVIQGGERRRKKSRKGGDMHEWPHEIRIRQMPDGASRVG